MSFNSKYEGAEVEALLDKVANGSSDVYYLDCGADISVKEGTIDLSEWDKLASARIIMLRFGTIIHALFLRTTTMINSIFSARFIDSYSVGRIDLLVVSFQKGSDSITWTIDNISEQMNTYRKYGMSETVYTIEPNEFYVWGEVASLDLSFAEEILNATNEYTFQFTSGATPTSLTLPDTIQWVNGAPSIEANKTYQVSIVNNIGLIVSV